MSEINESRIRQAGELRQLEAKIANLEVKVANLCMASAQIKSQASIPSRVETLEAEVKDLLLVQTNSAVAIQGYIFSSVTDTQSWLRNNVRDSAAYVLFVDLHSFLAIIAADQASNDPLAFTKALRDAKKAGFDSVWEAAILGSFDSGLPSVFGQRSKSVASKFDTRDLPRLPTFDQFRDLSDPSGFALWFLNQIEQTRGSLRHQAEIKLTGHALKVSMEMIWLRSCNSRIRTHLLDVATIQGAHGASS